MEYEKSRCDGRDAFDKNDLIEDLKDEVNYLKKKVKLYKCSEEEFENEMHVIESKNKNLKKELEVTKKEMIEARDLLKETESIENMEIEELELKQNIANGLIQKLKNDVKALEYLRNENNVMESEVKKLKKEKDISEETLKKEKKELEAKLLKAEAFKNEKDDEIGQLKNAIDQKTHEELNKTTEKEEECTQLKKENEYMLIINTEKQQLLVTLTKENETMKDELEILKLEVKGESSQLIHSNSIFKEIQHTNNILTCLNCTQLFSTKNKVTSRSEKCHGKVDFSELRVTISTQKEQLMKTISQVREAELIRKYSCNSNCKSSCRIFHEKHDWVKPVSKELFLKMDSSQMQYLLTLI